MRVVAYFNPQIFAQQRRQAQSTVAELEKKVEALTERLANPRARLKVGTAVHQLQERLRHHDLLNVFEVTSDSEHCNDSSKNDSPLLLALVRNEAQWQRRSSFDGFSVLVAHPEAKCTATELRALHQYALNLYGFTWPSTVVKLRPVRHRTDVKVRAHVSLCLLALYVQRERRRRAFCRALFRATRALPAESLPRSGCSGRCLRVATD